jgi:hypothetical protein
MEDPIRQVDSLDVPVDEIEVPEDIFSPETYEFIGFTPETARKL